MRTDVNIDRRQVRLPNASTLGYGEWKAWFGDFVTFRDNGIGFGRVAGRVTDPREQNKVYLLVITLGSQADHAFERWLEPGDILTCTRPENFDRDVLEFLVSPAFMKESVDTLRQTYSGGYNTPDKFRAWKQRIASDKADYEARHANCKTEPCEFHVKFAAIL